MKILQLCLYLLCAFFLTSCTIRNPEIMDSKQLKLDPNIEFGILDNGLKYYILKNSKPKNYAELKLLVNVGSLQEEDDQLGIAHFVEHMAFNGTKNFQKNDAIKFMESIGIPFGSHVNASTGYERTLYRLTIPTQDNKIIDKTLTILEDWAHNLLFDQDEFDKERGVVVEENRARDGIGYRLYKDLSKTIFNNARYAYRMPIGDMNIIQNIKTDRAKQFYDTWYRPEFMSVVVVGDVDVAVIKTFIVEKFSKIKNKSNIQKQDYEVEKTNKTRLKVLSDKEYTKYNFDLIFLRKPIKIQTIEDLKNSTIEAMVSSIFNQRLSELSKIKDPAFNSSHLANSRYVNAVKISEFSIEYEKNRAKIAMKTLFEEIARVYQHGFLDLEIEREKKVQYSSAKNLYEQRLDQTNENISNSIISKLIYNGIYQSGEDLYQNKIKVLEEITKKDLEIYFKNLLDNREKLYLFTLPENEKDAFLTIEEIDGIYKKAFESKLQNRVESKIDKIVKEDLKSFDIVNSEFNEEINLTKYELQNGIIVYLKKTDFQTDSFIFNSFSKGGYSLFSKSDYLELSVASELIKRSGYKDISLEDLNRYLSGKIVNVYPYIGNYFNGLKGNGRDEDLKDLFELIYLYYTKADLDENVFSNYKRDLINNIENKTKKPAHVYSEKRADFLYEKNIYVKGFREIEEVQALKKENILNLFNKTFHTQIPTFIFVGDIQEDRFEEYIKKYLSSITFNKSDLVFNNLNIKVKNGIDTLIDKTNSQNRSEVIVHIKKEKDYNYNDFLYSKVIERVLSIRMREKIREEKSGVYNIGFNITQKRVMENIYTATVSFLCDVQRTDELISEVKNIISDFVINGISDDELERFKLTMKNAYDKGYETNDFWLSNLYRKIKYGDLIEHIVEYKNSLDSIKKDSVNKFIKDFFDSNNQLITIFTTADYK